MSAEKRFMLLALIVFLNLGLSPSQNALAQIPAGDVQYVCPPCGTDCHGAVYTAQGECPVCHMVLVDKRRVDSGELKRRSVAILIFDGVQIIDYTGPYEVFGQAGFQVFTVAKKKDTITTNMGMSVTPKHDLKSCPKPDLIVIPGGGVDETENDNDVLDWIRERSVAAEYVLSVCNGAFILARTGLLDGLSATTFYGLIDELKAAAPNVNVVSDQRFVDNGKFITTAGLSSGIDGSLHVISRIKGKGEAQRVALNMEYQWDPDSKYARAALADRHLRRLAHPAGSEWKLLSTEGDVDRWKQTFVVRADDTVEALMESIDNMLAGRTWNKTDLKKTKGTIKSFWEFRDDQDDQWKGVASIHHMTSDAKTYLVSLQISRGDLELSDK